MLNYLFCMYAYAYLYRVIKTIKMNTNLIEKLKHLPDDRIGDGIYAAYEWGEKKLIRLYIGSKTNGPMLQYYYDGCGPESEGMYTGKSKTIFKNGCWTNCYSRGNFGKKYAFGGTWAGHNKNLHSRLRLSPIVDETYEMLLDGEGNQVILPEGIKGEIGVTEMDCSGSWVIWYNSAKEALSARLTRDEVEQSSLPEIFRQHFMKNETGQVIDALNDVIETYEL